VPEETILVAACLSGIRLSFFPDQNRVMGQYIDYFFQSVIIC
jgi:hypothetical protein